MRLTLSLSVTNASTQKSLENAIYMSDETLEREADACVTLAHLFSVGRNHALDE